MRIKNIWFNSVMMILSLQCAGLTAQTDTVCFNDTILYQIPGPKGSVYNWTVSGGSVIYSSVNKDSVIVVWNESTGLHTVEATKFNKNSCESEPERLVVFVYQPTIDLGKDKSICEGSSELLTVQPGYKEYLWNNQPGTNEFRIDSAGIIKLEIKDKYGCRASDSISITENKNPQPDFTVDLDIINQSASLHNLSDSTWQYHWDFGDGTQSDKYNPNTHSYTDPGTYKITLTASANGCSGTLSREVSTIGAIKADFAAVYQGCAPVNVTFKNLSTGADTYYWDFGNGKSSTDETPVTRYDIPGTYEVTLYAKKDTVTSISKKSILVHQAPVANFDINPTETDVYNNVDFINKSTNAVKYSWNFGDGDSSGLYEPTHSYSSGGVYTVSLKVWSGAGCSDSLSVINAITVGMDCRMLFPNGFIPDKNGPSGGNYDPDQKTDNNTIFHPIHENHLDNYELRIYNRWGILVFVSHNIDIGWDGYYKGRLAPQDTYIYKAKATCSSGKEISAMGSVTLIY